MAERIRAYDWTGTPLGPLASWPQSLRTAVDMMLAMADPATIFWGPQHVQIYNDAYVAIARDRHPDLLGHPAREGWPDAHYAVLGPSLDSTRAGHATRLTDRFLPLEGPDGQVGERPFTNAWTPIRDETGAIAGALQTLVEATERLTAQTAMRESEARHRLLIGSWAQAVWETDASGVVVADSPSWRDYTGQTLQEWLGYGWLDAIHPDDRAYAEQQWREAMAVHGFVNAEFRLHAPDGSWRWTNVRAAPVLDEGGNIEKWAGMNIDIDDRKRAEAALRESEERQAFLLKLSDAMGPLADPVAIQNAAMRVLGHHLGAFRAQYFEAEGDGEHANSRAGYSDPLETFVTNRILMDDFGSFVAADLRAGKTIVVSDTADDPRVSGSDLKSYQAWKMGAYVAVPLVKDDRFVVCIGVHSGSARDWTRLEISLIEDAAERTWAAVERARAETALRESEERFTQFANASAGGLWIRDAETLAMEYVSPSVGRIYGVSSDELLGEVEKWAALVLPEDRDIALQHLEQARHGKSVAHEFRIQRNSDGKFRWIRNTDFPLRSNGRIQRVGGIAEDVSDRKLAAEHQAILLAELQHRVRNIMAIIRSIVARTAKGASSIDGYAELLSGRLLAIARVQALLTRAANVGVGFATILSDELGAQAAHADQFSIAGPHVELAPKAAETMTLAIHELTTNALKYGALSSPTGRIDVRWSVEARGETHWLVFDWTESVASDLPAPATPRRKGFGSELIEGRVPYELNGRGEVRIDPGGAKCHIEFPLKDGASVLETDAPQPANVFGGAIDMTGKANLAGQMILIVEDEYYLASDTARALRGAGAAVVGPCATEESARGAIADASANGPVTGAVLDISLRGGRSFDLAREFIAIGVPFLFVTGYDQGVIPPEFENVKRLQKPVEFRTIGRELADIVATN